VKNRAPLVATPYGLLRLTSVLTQGWLKRQLQIPADGLSGHVEEISEGSRAGRRWLGSAVESWSVAPTI